MSEKNSQPMLDLARDVLLWKRKKMSLMAVSMATATWVLMEIYQFNFITIISWMGMAIVISLFLWGNVCRLFGKEPPSLYGLEITEESSKEMGIAIRESMEEAVGWMFKVGAESEWYVFGGVVGVMWIVAKLGGYLDLLTLVYIGIMMSMTFPVTYVKYEDEIKRCGERVKVHWGRLCKTVDEKIFRKLKNNLFKNTKEKKVE